MSIRIRPNVRLMEPYSPGKPVSEVKRELGLDQVVKLASNENPLGPSPMAMQAVSDALGQMHIYPDGSAYEVKKAISAKYGVPMNQVLLGNGSDELIHLLGLVFLDGPDDEIVVGNPSFVRYDAAANLANAKIIRVPLDRDFVHDLPAMAEAVTPNTKIVFIANPNNPTGTIVHDRELAAFLSAVPDDVAVVLDEAYFEFAMDEPGFPNSLDYIQEYPNVVGLRTFSKAYGLAGIRVGYGFASAEMVDAVDRAREPFDVNSLAQVAAVAALADESHMAKTVANNREGAQRIAEVLQDAGAKVCPTFANFVFADLGRPARPVFEALLRLGVIVRSAEAMGKPDCLRISVGTPQEVDTFIEAFKKVVVV